MNTLLRMGDQLDKKVTVYSLALLFLGSLLAFMATSWSLARLDASPWEQMSAHLEKVVLALGMCALCCATPYRRVGQLAVVGRGHGLLLILGRRHSREQMAGSKGPLFAIF